MKHFIFFILIISVAVQGSLAGYRFCYKTNRLKMAAFSWHTPAPRKKQSAPVNALHQCPPTFVAVLQRISLLEKNAPTPVQLKAGYKNVFFSQYSSNPPFAPPRLY